MDTSAVETFLRVTALQLGIKILAAIACWVVGRWISVRVVKLVRAGMDRKELDPTLAKYVVASPPPEVNLLDLNLLGAVIAVRPYCRNEHYWQVYFDTNEAILRTGAAAGWPAPTPLQIGNVQQLA